MIKSLTYHIPKGGAARVVVQPTEGSWDGSEEVILRGEGILSFSGETSELEVEVQVDARKYPTIESFLEALVEGLEDGGDK